MINRAGWLARSVREVKHRWDYRRWRRAGGSWERPGVPHVVKRLTLLDYRARFALRQFVETGTFTGDMIAAMRPHFDLLVSIELGDELYRHALARFNRYDNVRLYQGDSSAILPGVVAALRAPALFWLDAHASGGLTARGALETPVLHELAAILTAPEPFRHVVLIDDARLFDGTRGYPTIADIERQVRHRRQGLAVQVADDIVRIAGIR